MARLPLFVAVNLLSLLSFPLSALSYTWPDPQYDVLESLLYEGRRSDGSNLASLVHPCRKRAGTMASVPAEWLRFVRSHSPTRSDGHSLCALSRHFTIWLHTTLTKAQAVWMALSSTNSADQRSVHSWSISQVSSRLTLIRLGQNFGLGFNQTLSDFQIYPNKLVSRTFVTTFLSSLHSYMLFKVPTLSLLELSLPYQHVAAPSFPSAADESTHGPQARSERPSHNTTSLLLQKALGNKASINRR